MYVDQELVLAEKQTTTTGTDTGLLSTNVIDLKHAGREIGVGKRLAVLVEVTTTLAGAVTLHVDLQSDSAPEQNVAAVVHQRLCSLPQESAAGTRFIAYVQPMGAAEMKRYLAAKFTSSGGALSGGAVSVMIVDEADLTKSYPNVRVIA